MQVGQQRVKCLEASIKFIRIREIQASHPFATDQIERILEFYGKMSQQMNLMCFEDAKI